MTYKMNINNIGRIVVILTILSIFITCASAQESKIVVSTNRQIILDDPSGWVNAGWGGQTARGNQILGEETAIRWYALVTDSNGTAIPGVSVTSQLKFPNGTVQYSDTKTTDSKGLVEFSRNLDNLNQRPYLATSTEGYWQIDVSTTGGSSNTQFIYDEIGCGKSGSACHKSQDWQPLSGISTKNLSNSGSFISISKNSPYVQKRDKIHGTLNGHGHVDASPQILSGECMTCHKSYNGTYVAASERQYFDPQYPLGVHQGKVNCTQCHGIYDTSGPEVPDMPIKKCYDCHPLKNDNLTSMIYAQNDASSYSYLPLTSSEINGHNQNIPCITCHNNGHNVTKPLLDGTSNKITESQQCQTCHSTYEKHNNKVDCTVCHSQDAHEIKIFSQDGGYVIGLDNPLKGNCTNCHEDPTYLNTLLGQPRAGEYIGSGAPQIPPNFRHSGQIGDKWNRTDDPAFWTNSYTACKYCHGDTKHNNTAFGKPNSFKGTNVIGTYGTWCGGCHYQGDSNWNTMTGIMNLIPPEITGHATYGSYGSKYFNHNTIGGFEDTKCKKCHGNKPEVTTLMHQVSPGGGGPDCVACHDATLGGDLPHVDVSSMNGINSIHKDLNKDAPSSVDSDNKRCWSCHGNGTEPDKHPDNYKTPAKCIDCHTGSNRNFTPSNAIKVVSEHYWNGQQIITSGVSSCYTCHNKSEMMIIANDPDVGSGDVYGGDNGGNNSTSHYGKKRTDLNDGTSNYCNYCHNSTTGSSSFFDVFVDIDNRNIENHSRYTTNPKCQDCHGSFRIHDSDLKLDILTLPTSTICLDCHGPGGTASINDKEKHNNVVDCSLCHLDNGRGIHPIKYLNNTGGFNLDKNDGVKCIYCHESGLYNAPGVGQVRHSINPMNGSLWNAGRPSTFWDNNNPSTECDYCHGNSKHSIDAVGKSVNFKGTNTVNVYGNWCGTCHYQRNSKYNNMIATMNPLVPPEISKNTTYGNYGAASDGTPYYNHSLGPYSDEECKYCHSSDMSSNLTKLMHNVEVGGTSCIGCHSIPGSNYFVNTTKFGMHANISRTEGNGIVSDNDCKVCHFGVLTMDKMLPGYANITNTYYCQDCHKSGGRNATQYNSVPTELRVNTLKHATNNCEQCHINNNAGKYHPGGPIGTAYDPVRNKTRNCFSCHYRSDGNGDGGPTIGLNDAPFNAPGEVHGCSCHSRPRPTISECDVCHSGGVTHNIEKAGHENMGTSLDQISIPTSVNSGDIATVSARAYNTWVQIARAQYRVMDTSNTVVIRDWTDMSATDGKFDGLSEYITGNIDTTGLSGNYIVLIRAMDSGHYAKTGGSNHVDGRPYYPYNGAWTKTAWDFMTVVGTSPTPTPTPIPNPTWSGWINQGGRTAVTPDIAEFNGKLYGAVRGFSTSSIWINYMNTNGVWTPWTTQIPSTNFPGALVGTGPSIYSFNNRLYVMAIGADNAIYSNSLG